jgi:uncharacterized protein (TIGR00251 family)
MPLDGARLSVKVVPNASRNEIAGSSGGVWRIKIAAPPDKGKANKELVGFLSNCLGVKKSALNIVRGHASHSKLLSVEGLTGEQVNTRLSSGCLNN